MVERLLAVGVFAASLIYLASAWGPGAGFYPVAVGVFGASVILAWLATALRGTATGHAVAIPADARGRVLITAGLLAGFCLALPWTGYLVAAFLFTGLLLRGLGAGWATALVIGAASALASNYGFGVLLGVPLPRGVFLD